MQPAAEQNRAPSFNNTLVIFLVMAVLDSLFFVWARLLFPYIAPRVSVVYVMLLSSIQIGVIAALRKKLRLSMFLRNWRFYLVIGLLVAASTYINYEAIAFIDPGTASMLSQFSIVFGLLWGLVWLREKFTSNQFIGAVIAVLGVLVVTFQEGDYMRLGSLMVLSSALMYSFHAALVKRHGGEFDFFEFFFFRLASTLFFASAFLLGSGGFQLPSPRAWLLLVLVATFDIALGRSLYYIVLRRINISLLSVLLTLSPLLTVLWSLLLFKVTPTLLQLIGGLGILAGVALVSRSQKRP